MKTFKLFFFSLLFLTGTAFAQTKTETIRVAGECGMCKKKIETAAKTAGATHALWNPDTKKLTVTYAQTTSSTERIEKAVAAEGYDTERLKATDESYAKLHACCKYDRSAAASAAACCTDDKCAGSGCMKDGTCEKDKSCCKDSGCDKKDCCKKA